MVKALHYGDLSLLVKMVWVMIGNGFFLFASVSSVSPFTLVGLKGVILI